MKCGHIELCLLDVLDALRHNLDSSCGEWASRMTFYEWQIFATRHFLPVLPHLAYREIRRLTRQSGVTRPKLLDVGGRKSPYTVGIAADVTVSDIPRETEVQSRLHLGFSDQILLNLQRRRSNIVGVVLEDMCRSAQPSDHFDGVVCVEVIEHVPEDDAFVAQIARVIRPGGWLFLTTPNGDYVKNEPPNYNPDHVRHYTRSALESLLSSTSVKCEWTTRSVRANTAFEDSRASLRRDRCIASLARHAISSIDLNRAAYRRAHVAPRI